MKLRKSQVNFIEQDLISRGIQYAPLREDLVDHICTEVEQKMDQGMNFKDSYQLALELFLPEELNQINKSTMNSLTSVSLLKSYLLTASRNLLRNKGLAAINVFGLTVSLSICMLIFVFIQYELSYDQQHPESHLFRLTSQIKQDNGQTSATAFTAAPWGPAMVEEFPQLLSMGRIMKYRLDVIVTDQKTNNSYYESDLIWGDQELLHFFDINLIQGNKNKALESPHSVVISRSVAKQYFGENEAIGQVLVYNNEVNLTVTGIMEDMPENMHFKADFICSFSTLNSFWRIINNWGILYYHTYFKIQGGTDIAALDGKFEGFFQSRMGTQWTEKRSVKLQNVKDIHLTAGVADGLKAGTNPEHLYILGVVAIIILFLACANFINLNIARSLRRMKEVGIRKVMGGLKADLMQQFLLESGMLTLFSLVLACVISLALLPYFNNLLDKQLTLFASFDTELFAVMVLVFLMITCLAGLFPAIKASSLETLMALKGKLSSRLGHSSLGDALLFFQYVICGVLIIAIGTIKLQQQFINNKDLGYSKERLIMLPTTNMETDELLKVKNKLLSIPSIQSVSITSHKLAGDQPYFSRYVFSGLGEISDTLGLTRLHIDEDFIHTYNLNLLAGRDYNPGMSTDTTSFIINERTAKMLGKTPDQAIQMTISYLTQGEHGRYPRTGKVIGVVEDFHFQSMHEEIEGLVMDIQPPRAHFIACKVTDISKDLVTQIESSIAPYTDGIPMDYSLMQDQVDRLYVAEKKFDVLISIASALAIIIAFLGLFGLVSQLSTYRKKEIGLRKVLGANIMGITSVLSKKYIQMILFSYIIGFPISYLWMNNWLQNYPYRIDFPFLWMIITGFLILGIALLTISFLTLRIARSNPIQALKEE